MDGMTDQDATTAARRRLTRTIEVRAIARYVIGAAVALAIVSGVRLLAGEDQVYPTVIVSVLVLVGLGVDALTRRRYADALGDLELAARNAGRAEALSGARRSDDGPVRSR